MDVQIALKSLEALELKVAQLFAWLAEAHAQDLEASRAFHHMFLQQKARAYLIQFEKRLPSTEIHEFVVTPEVVANAADELEHVLNRPGDPERKARFDQASLRERELFRDSIWRRDKEILQLYHLPLTEARVELIIELFLRWDADLKSACGASCPTSKLGSAVVTQASQRPSARLKAT